MKEYTPEMVARAEAMGHHENAEHMRARMADNLHHLPTRTEYQYRSQLTEDAKQFGEAKFRQGYAVGRWDGYKAAAVFTGPVFLVGVGLGVVLTVAAAAWL